MREPEIIEIRDSIEFVKEFGTKVNYYLFEEYEIHTNIIPVGTEQDWHYHNKIEETILVTQGEVQFSWIENKKRYDRILQQGDIVRVKHSTHTFTNISNQECRCVVFRFVPDGKNRRELIKNDKTIVDIG